MFHAQLNVGHKRLYAKVTMIDDFGVIVQCFNYIAFGFLFLGIVEVFLCIILLVRNQTGYLGIPFFPKDLSILLMQRFFCSILG